MPLALSLQLTAVQPQSCLSARLSHNIRRCCVVHDCDTWLRTAGMSALTLFQKVDGARVEVPLRFRVDLTVTSAVVCAILTRIGIEVALHDCFGGQDR